MRKKTKTFKVYQHVYIDSRQKPSVAVLVERQSDGNYFRNIETFPAYDLNTVAQMCWGAYKSILFDDYDAEEVVLNCNILGRIVARREKDGGIVEHKTNNVSGELFAAGGDA